jgi:putative transferase (TIGR04331 family)
MSENTPNTNYLSAFSPERLVWSARVLKELTVNLNEIHQTDYSERFWKIIIGSYINSVISRKEFLSSKVLDIPALFEPINGTSHPGTKERVKRRLRYYLKSMQAIGGYSLIKKTLLEQDNISWGFHDPVSVSKDIGGYVPIYSPFLGKGDPDKRKRAIQVAEKQDDVFINNVTRQLPEIFIEHFQEIMDSIPIHNPEKKTLHTSTIGSFFMKYMIAKYINSGAKFYIYQHGAYYGEMENHNSHKHESGLADKFVTWGWKLTEKDVPGKAYRLEKFKREYLAHKQDAVYDCLFCYPEINNRSRELFKGYTDDLSAKLDASKYGRLIARPRPSSKLPFASSKIDFPVSGRVTIDSAKLPMSHVMSKARLVIQFTVPATNFTECLYVDHPTVGLLNNDQPTAIVKPYYDFLLESGVLHNDFNSLISHLNTINLDEWWSNVIKHPTYQAFKNEFLRAV